MATRTVSRMVWAVSISPMERKYKACTDIGIFASEVGLKILHILFGIDSSPHKSFLLCAFVPLL